MYNFYQGANNPTTCAPPTAGSQNQNNGNAWGYYYNDNMNALNHTATYGYDAVNRLTSAAATGQVGYNQAYSYAGDGSGQFGNLGCTPAGPGCVSPTYNPASNQVTTYTYSSAGNLLNIPGQYFDWDVDGHMTQAWSGGTGGTYYYNALGQRNRCFTSNGNFDELYGADGALLWRNPGDPSDPNWRAFVPFMGRNLAEYYGGTTPGTIFHHPDEIGSATTGSDYAGNIISEKLFYPFGEFWNGAAIPNPSMHQTFAQLPDYDPESDLYNTPNRHFSPTGRWLSPDPGGLKVFHPDDPQTWNMYAYVRNNPTTLADPTGLEEVFGNGAVNYLRNPASAEHWIVNGISNTVSDLLSLDDVAKGSVDMVQAETTTGKVGTALGLGLLVGLNVFTGGEGDAAKAAMAESKTFAEAVQGGAHAGFLRNYLERSTGEISKGIESIGKQIAEHQEKIANPEKFVKDWASKSEREQQGLINKWQKDINRQTQQKEILEKLKDVKEHQ